MIKEFLAIFGPTGEYIGGHARGFDGVALPVTQENLPKAIAAVNAGVLLRVGQLSLELSKQNDSAVDAIRDAHNEIQAEQQKTARVTAELAERNAELAALKEKVIKTAKAALSVIENKKINDAESCAAIASMVRNELKKPHERELEEALKESDEIAASAARALARVEALRAQLV